MLGSEAIARADTAVSKTWQHLGLEGEPPRVIDLMGQGLNGFPHCHTEGGQVLVCLHHLGKYNQWARAGDTRVPPPLADTLRVWAACEPVAPDIRRDSRILPVIVDKTSVKADNEVALLNLVDCAGQSLRTQGRGAPLEARLMVSVLLAAPQKARAGCRLELTLRDLVDDVYAGKWNRGKQWPALRQALERLGEVGFVMPGRTSIWRPVIIRGTVPAIDAPLDTPVTFAVALPPGSHTGPMIDPKQLAALGVRSGPKWRAFIAAHSLTWKPGTTRVPAGKGHYGWTSNPQKYPVLPAEDRRRLAFGESTGDRTTDQLDAPWEDIPGLVRLKGQVDPKTGARGMRFLPEPVAEKMSASGGK